jgi:hypothetical protein
LTAGARDGGLDRMELDDDKIDDAVLAQRDPPVRAVLR